MVYLVGCCASRNATSSRSKAWRLSVCLQQSFLIHVQDHVVRSIFQFVTGNSFHLSNETGKKKVGFIGSCVNNIGKPSCKNLSMYTSTLIQYEEEWREGKILYWERWRLYAGKYHIPSVSSVSMHALHPSLTWELWVCSLLFPFPSWNWYNLIGK